VTHSSCLILRVCDGPVVLHALLQQQHGAAKEGRGTLWNGAAVSFSDGRLVVEGYPIPRGALGASLHTRRLRERGGGSATSAAERRHWEVCASSECGLTRAFASPLVACTQFAWDDTDHIPDAATTRQAPTSISNPICRTSLLHPGGGGTQRWQPALR
jgi:hypothetical protein